METKEKEVKEVKAPSFEDVLSLNSGFTNYLKKLGFESDEADRSYDLFLMGKDIAIQVEAISKAQEELIKSTGGKVRGNNIKFSDDSQLEVYKEKSKKLMETTIKSTIYIPEWFTVKTMLKYITVPEFYQLVDKFIVDDKKPKVKEK